MAFSFTLSISLICFILGSVVVVVIIVLVAGFSADIVICLLLKRR